MYKLIGHKLWRYPALPDGRIYGVGILVHANIPANITSPMDALAWVQAQEETDSA